MIYFTKYFEVPVRVKVSFFHTVFQALWALTTQMKSFDMTTLLLLKLRKANPVGILAGNELQNGLHEGLTTISNSSSTKESEKEKWTQCEDL